MKHYNYYYRAFNSVEHFSSIIQCVHNGGAYVCNDDPDESVHGDHIKGKNDDGDLTLINFMVLAKLSSIYEILMTLELRMVYK